MKTSIPPVLITIALVCFGLLPKAQAVVPPPDGGYPNFTTAEGQNALFSLTTGAANTAVGWFSLFSNTEGSFNTATGAGALLFNTANENTAFGAAALLFNTAGQQNTAVGAAALVNNNSVVTVDAPNGGPASANTAVGARALLSNTTGAFNTANGAEALENNTTGGFNTANGFGALLNNTTGSFNTAIGRTAGLSVGTASNVTCLGAGASGAELSNTTWIANVYGVATQNIMTAPVLVSAAGQLGTVVSSERFKKDVITMDTASEAILSLRPVTFHYKTDGENTPQFGLIAEEVAKVNPALVLPDKEGKPYTVRYDAVNAMLLNEFLKEHRKVEEQQATITELKSAVAQQKKNFQATVAQLTARLDEQASQIQKVSAQIEASRPAPQVVKNP